MGLCKCPQRKVTNIFCYEHRVNVCEHCLMQNHPKCVVDTYRNWITDSVFSPKCNLCSEHLVNKETVRLLCFHIVHWDCLDSYAKALPATTAPAGYNCPVCKRMCLFPALNQVSPIADALRAKMGESDWARAGLGLPVLNYDSDTNSNTDNVTENGSVHSHSFNVHKDASMAFNNRPESQRYENAGNIENNTNNMGNITKNGTKGFDSAHMSTEVKYSNHVQPQISHATGNPSYTSPSSTSFSKMYSSDISNNDMLNNPNPRKGANKFDYEMPLLFDEDEHKYRRKSPFEALSRWLKNANPATSRRKTRKRTIIYAIVTIIVLIVMFMILFGRNEEYDDGFDPKLNPNVIIGERQVLAKGHEDS